MVSGRWKIEDGRQKMEERRWMMGDGPEKRKEKSIVRFKEVYSYLLLSPFSLMSSPVHADELRDVKPPVDLPSSPWPLIITAVVIAAGLAFAVWYWFRHMHKFLKPVVVKTSWELAYERLQNLRQRDLFGQGMAKEHFIELSTIARKYIEDRFDIHAPEMTTEEFLDHVKNTPLIETKHKEILKSFLRLSDMVKFAKYPPSADEALQSFELAKKFVDDTKAELKSVS